MALARADTSEQRFYGMSAQIRRERTAYYNALEWTQKGDTDITQWQDWFLRCLLRALDDATQTIDAVMAKARFWERLATVPLNARQTNMLNKLLDGFRGKLTSTKWAKITKCSQDTAHRDILDLINTSSTAAYCRKIQAEGARRATRLQVLGRLARLTTDAASHLGKIHYAGMALAKSNPDASAYANASVTAPLFACARVDSAAKTIQSFETSK